MITWFALSNYHIYINAMLIRSQNTVNVVQVITDHWIWLLLILLLSLMIITWCSVHVKFMWSAYISELILKNLTAKRKKKNNKKREKKIKCQIQRSNKNIHIDKLEVFRSMAIFFFVDDEKRDNFVTWMIRHLPHLIESIKRKSNGITAVAHNVYKSLICFFFLYFININ